MEESKGTTGVPEEMELEEHLFDLQFSPTEPRLAVCDVEGNVYEFGYSAEGITTPLWQLKYHDKSCRRVCYSKDGKYLLTGSKDRSIGIVSSGQLCCRLQKAHKSPISALMHLEGAVLASGDDDGTVKVWDIRAQAETAVKPSLCFEVQADTITEFALEEDRGTLLATSTDGTLTAYDLRQPKGAVQDRSNSFEEDLLSLAVLKLGKKVVVGSQEGSLHLFSRELLQVSDDRINGHPASVDTIAKVDDDTIITGCEDGLVRGIGVHPNKILCVLYGMSESPEKALPIQRVAASADKNLGAAIYENHVAFYNLAYLKDRDKVAKGRAEAAPDPFFDKLN